GTVDGGLVDTAEVREVRSPRGYRTQFVGTIGQASGIPGEGIVGLFFRLPVGSVIVAQGGSR
ncbi:MAG TPA: hypothetical protein DCR93_08145, partial [Cytophagales bacterium]|nr:hypothetical protein [Cytophagales bacterium]